jgi:glycosyltransferase involved in cell wall biosynthesis
VTRVVGLVPYALDRAPGQRYRIEQWAPLMEALGVHVVFAPFLDARGMAALYQRGRLWAKTWAIVGGYRRRLMDLRDLTGFDVVYVYREAALLGPSWLEDWLAQRRPLVFDFDDAIYLPASSAANPWTARFKAAGKVAKICGLARHVTVGNEFLATYARRHAPQVTVVPTTIDTRAYAVRSREPNPRPVVGWTGSTTTVGYLELVRPALKRLRSEMDFTFRAIGAPVEVGAVTVEPVPWRSASEADDLRPMDVGLMPLPDDEWSRGKCGCKALQYMALGIPPVVSPVGVNRSIVRDGVNGFWASTQEEWVDRIGRLLRDPSLRARLGAEARRTVEAEYSAEKQAPRMAEVLREAAGR